jgi:hypothetical protein
MMCGRGCERETRRYAHKQGGTQGSVGMQAECVRCVPLAPCLLVVPFSGYLAHELSEAVAAASAGYLGGTAGALIMIMHIQRQ